MLEFIEILCFYFMQTHEKETQPSNYVLCAKSAFVRQSHNVRWLDISATDISATDVSAWTFRPRKMSKVDVSAITINLGFGMCACIFFIETGKLWYILYRSK